MPIQQSNIMYELYGHNARAIYDQYQALSSNFNRLIQEVVYDVFWSRPGLSLKEKSYVTVISLIALAKEEQLKIHLDGFFNLGGKPKIILQTLNYMHSKGYIPPSHSAFSTLQKMISKIDLGLIANSDYYILTDRQKSFIDFSYHIALGKQNKTEECIKELLKKDSLSVEELENIMLQQIIYCGFPCAMNGLALLKLIRPKIESKNLINPRKSVMMDELYGCISSQAVYDRCQSLSPNFNYLVQRIVYDIFWHRPGLSLKEKSFVTIISLITLKKEEQLQIHLSGFINLGGTPNIILQTLNYMKEQEYISSVDEGLLVLKKIIYEKELVLDIQNTLALTEREKAIIDFSSCFALDKKDKMKNCIESILKSEKLSLVDLENIMLHEMIYSGFPCAMNTFAMMKQLTNSEVSKIRLASKL
ncbi:MAG: hypothetical protein KIT27_06195 [Legionellales bacterium]|nr:hypothetical protein [Legionellales bacterium]